MLGIDAAASLDTIAAAYRKLATIHHPDKGGAKEAWDELQRAYEQALNQEAPLP